MTAQDDPQEMLDLVVGVVTAYVSNNSISGHELSSLVGAVHEALHGLTRAPVDTAMSAPKPAVNPRRSVNQDYIVCLEDGLKFKSLRRHLRTRYNMTPEDYRLKWGLAPDYPMVAPNYAKARSELAKSMGLGQRRARKASGGEDS